MKIHPSINNFAENASLLLVTKAISKDTKQKTKVETLVINGEQIDDVNFLPDHDVFHWVIDSNLFHNEYKSITGIELEREISTSFHGEGLIEIFSRFFGNLEPETYKKYDENRILIGEYVKMPKIQIGAKPNQPFRTFPLKVNCTNVLTKTTSIFDHDYEKSVDATKRYTIIGSLVSGEILSKFIEPNQRIFSNPAYQLPEYYLSLDFKTQIQEYITNPPKNVPDILSSLDSFLRLNYDSSLGLTLQTVDKYILAFYEVFLSHVEDIIDEGEDYLLFSVLDGNGNLNLLGEIFCINRNLKLSQSNEINTKEIQNIRRKIIALKKYHSKMIISNNVSANNLKIKISELEQQLHSLLNDQYNFFGFCRLP
jgi:hypothetical protein